MHIYIQEVQEIFEVTHAISNALHGMSTIADPKIISLLREQGNHDQIVFEVRERYESTSDQS